MHDSASKSFVPAKQGEKSLDVQRFLDWTLPSVWERSCFEHVELREDEGKLGLFLMGRSSEFNGDLAGFGLYWEDMHPNAYVRKEMKHLIHTESDALLLEKIIDRFFPQEDHLRKMAAIWLRNDLGMKGGDTYCLFRRAMWREIGNVGYCKRIFIVQKESELTANPEKGGYREITSILPDQYTSFLEFMLHPPACVPDADRLNEVIHASRALS